MWKQKVIVLTLGYEFMYAEYKKETRRRSPDQTRLGWFKDQMLIYQATLKNMFPETKWKFTEL